MAFGDTAKAALAQALEAYKAVVRLEAIVERVEKAAESFQRRVEERLEANDRRANDKINDLERRIRELETKNASLAGKVDGALAEAYKVVMLDSAVKRKTAELNQTTPNLAIPISPDGSGVHVRADEGAATTLLES